MNKRGGTIQSSFLYYYLYPLAILTNGLINCWWTAGFLGEHDIYEEAYNREMSMIEGLKDVCLLETHRFDSVKMHDVRDVAVWLAMG